MLSYAVDGFIVTVTTIGETDPEQRTAILHAIRTDPAVPDGAVLLLNVDSITEQFDDAALRARLGSLIRAMGPRMAPVCAVVAPREYVLESLRFRGMAAEAGLRVGLFPDEPSARAWLSSYVPEQA